MFCSFILLYKSGICRNSRTIIIIFSLGFLRDLLHDVQTFAIRKPFRHQDRPHNLCVLNQLYVHSATLLPSEILYDICVLQSFSLFKIHICHLAQICDQVFCRIYRKRSGNIRSLLHAQFFRSLPPESFYQQTDLTPVKEDHPFPAA